MIIKADDITVQINTYTAHIHTHKTVRLLFIMWTKKTNELRTTSKSKTDDQKPASRFFLIY